MADLQALLAVGDVDAVRRLLKQGEAQQPTTPDPEPPPKPAIEPTTTAAQLFADRPIVQLSVEQITLQLKSVRTMGKLLWPAGESVARIFTRLAPASPPARPRGLSVVATSLMGAVLVAAAASSSACALAVPHRWA